MSTAARRLLPASLLFALALAVAVLAWPSTTVDAGGLNPCHEACSTAALACSIGCFDDHWGDFPKWKACENACDNELNACVAGCYP